MRSSSKLCRLAFRRCLLDIATIWSTSSDSCTTWKRTETSTSQFPFLIVFLNFNLCFDTRYRYSMNAANLAIVFAPTVTGMVYDGMNSYGVKLIEYLISNAARLFNFPPQETPLLPGCTNSPPTIEATPWVNRRLFSFILLYLALSFTFRDVSPPSTFTRAQLSISPRSFRPKEKAPPPPVDMPGTSSSTSTHRNLIEFTDDDDFSDDTEPFTSNGSSLARSSTEHRPNRPPPPARIYC